MPKYTENLELFKWNTKEENDLNAQFNLEKSMNENLDKIDRAFAELKDSTDSKIANKIDNKDNVIKFNMIEKKIQDFFKYNFENVEIEWENTGWYNDNADFRSNINYSNSSVDVNKGDIISVTTFNNGFTGFLLVDDNNKVILKSTETSSKEYCFIVPNDSCQILLSVNNNESKKAQIALKKCSSLYTVNIKFNEKSIDYSNFNDYLQRSIVENLFDVTTEKKANQYYLEDRSLGSMVGMRAYKADITPNDIYYLSATQHSDIPAYYIFDNTDTLIEKSSINGKYDTLRIAIPNDVSYILINSSRDITFKHLKNYTMKDALDLRDELNAFRKLFENFAVQEKTIICAGDSLTVGHNNVSTNSYVNYITRYYPKCAVKNNGGNGQGADWLVNQLTNQQRSTAYPTVVDPSYDDVCAVIINIGTNGGIVGSVETSIPKLANATDIEGNILQFMTVDNAIAEGGFNYNGENISSANDYWNLFANNWYGNLGLIIEYIQWKNPKTQIFLLPPCISTIKATNSNSAEKIGSAMKELCELYGINYIDINNAIGINRRNAGKYCGDYVHGTNLRNEMVGKYVAKYISDKIYDFNVNEN